MGPRALAELAEPAPAIRRRELDREDVAQLAVEVGVFRLGPLDHADVTSRIAARRLATIRSATLLPVPESPVISAKPPSWTSCSTCQANWSPARLAIVPRTDGTPPGSSAGFQIFQSVFGGNPGRLPRAVYFPRGRPLDRIRDRT